MCGIGLIYSTDGNIPVKLIPVLLLELERRGRDATGIYVYYHDDSFTLMKLPLTASEFVKKAISVGLFENIVKRRPRLILLHTRASTSGSPRYNENNHPLWEVFDNYLIVLVHNGVIRTYGKGYYTTYYHDSFLEDYKKREVDTDLLLAYLRKKYSENKKNKITEKELYEWIIHALEYFNSYGTINTLWHIYPSNIAVICKDSALEGVKVGDNMLVLASTWEILTTALAHVGLKKYEDIGLRRGIWRLDLDKAELKQVKSWERSYTYATSYSTSRTTSTSTYSTYTSIEYNSSRKSEEKKEEEKSDVKEEKKEKKRKRRERFVLPSSDPWMLFL